MNMLEKALISEKEVALVDQYTCSVASGLLAGGHYNSENLGALALEVSQIVDVLIKKRNEIIASQVEKRRAKREELRTQGRMKQLGLE